MVKCQGEKCFDLVVKRDNLWRSALPCCLHHLEGMFYELRIEFEGEEGMDAGALR